MVELGVTFMQALLRNSLQEQFCRELQGLCDNPAVAWPYHPRSGRAGRFLVDCLLKSLVTRSSRVNQALVSGEIRIGRGASIGRDRRKVLDVVIYGDSGDAPLAAIEAKVCMTAHAKAQSRLLAELNSSMDALHEESPGASFFAIVAVNYGLRFTSPLKLPGPNLHDEADGPSMVAFLEAFVSRSPRIRGALLLPIDFDNERVCRIPANHDVSFQARSQEAFENEIAAALNLVEL